MEKLLKSSWFAPVVVSSIMLTICLVSVALATSIGTNITTAGDVTLSSGALTLTAGSETISAGDLTLTLGNLAVSAGTLTVGGNSLFTTASSTGLFKITEASTTVAAFGDQGTQIRGIRFGTCATSTSAVSYTMGTTTSFMCTAPGVKAGDRIFVTSPNEYATSTNNWLIFEGASASTTGTIDIRIFNASSTVTLTGTAKTWMWMAVRP